MLISRQIRRLPGWGRRLGRLSLTGLLMGLLMGLLTGIGGCSPIALNPMALSPMVTVQSLQRPQGWSQTWSQTWSDWGNSIRLQGRVGHLAPLLKGQVYELQDATGKIWVLSPNRQLKSGQQIVVRGRLRREPIEIAGQNLSEVYIEEQQIEQQIEQQLTPTP